MHNLKRKLKDTVSVLEEKTDFKPDYGLILGSGLGILAEEIEESTVVPYKELPHFPVSTVEGHAGRLVFGYLAGQRVIAMQGRFHRYEGYSLGEVTYPVRLMQYLGVNKLIITNAAGGIGDHLKAGDLMLIKDHINLMGDNPLIGENEAELGPRFPDMSEAYNIAMRSAAQKIGEKLNIELKEGVYAGLTGPSYETPTEIRYLKSIGADAVGMSTVPEVIAANHGGLKVLGISCITNMAAGITQGKLNHEEVMATAEQTKEKFITLVKGILQDLDED